MPPTLESRRARASCWSMVARKYGSSRASRAARRSEARAMVAIGTISYLGSHGAELLRAGWTRCGARPEPRRSGRAGSTTSAARPTRPSCAGFACGSRTRARSSRSTGAAHPTRRPPARRSTRSPSKARAGGPAAPTGAARCSRCGLRSGSTRAPGSRRSSRARTSTRRCTSATTRPTSTRSGRSPR